MCELLGSVDTLLEAMNCLHFGALNMVRRDWVERAAVDDSMLVQLGKKNKGGTTKQLQVEHGFALNCERSAKDGSCSKLPINHDDGSEKLEILAPSHLR